MLRATALTRLTLYAQPTVEPTLSPTELDALLDTYAMADEQGLAPDELGWVGTWDIRAAARRAWLLKAGKVAGLVNITSDGQQTSYSDLHEHCLAQAKLYATHGSLSPV